MTDKNITPRLSFFNAPSDSVVQRHAGIWRANNVHSAPVDCGFLVFVAFGGAAMADGPPPPVTDQQTIEAAGLALPLPQIAQPVVPASCCPLLTTFVELTASPLRALLLEEETFTATLTDRSSGSSYSTIIFKRDDIEFGQAVTDNDGIAVLRASALGVIGAGTYQVTAEFLGDEFYVGSVSGALPVTIYSLSPTTTSIWAPSTGFVGEMLDFRATVISTGGTPTGRVSFRADGTEFANAALGDTGSVSVQRRTLPAGVHQITAHYLGTTGFIASESAAQSLTISDAAATTTTLTAPSTATEGAMLDLRADVSSAAGTPTGRVRFLLDGVIQVGSARLNRQGVARVSHRVRDLPRSYQITAEYQGNASFQPSDSAGQAIEILPRPPRNNLFADRIAIARPRVVTGTNVGATSEPGQPTISNRRSTNAVWWSYTPAEDGTVTLITCYAAAPTNSDFDTTLGVFTGDAVDALTLVAEDNDSVPDEGPCRNQAGVRFGATAGVEYQIAVAGNNNATGNIALYLDFAAATPALTQIAAGGNHTCAVDVAQDVYCWGSNSRGQLGRATDGPNSSTPLRVPLNTVQQVAAGFAHNCAMRANGRVFCWGANESGQLGIGSVVDSVDPVLVGGITGVAQVSAGSAHTCALRTDGHVMCWGANASGQLGDGTTVDRNTPVDVDGLTDAIMVVAGFDHTCALGEDGRVKCWGGDRWGQIGDGFPLAMQLTPVAVPRLANARQIAVGNGVSCAMLRNGTARCRGANGVGELGDGSTTNRDRPTRVARLPRRAGDEIATGWSHTCVLRTNGWVSCVGGNESGQLGDRSTIERHRLMRVNGFRDGVHVAAGETHSCAVQSTGHAYCWGDNTDGQLGNGTNINTNVPARVLLGPP